MTFQSLRLDRLFLSCAWLGLAWWLRPWLAGGWPWLASGLSAKARLGPGRHHTAALAGWLAGRPLTRLGPGGLRHPLSTHSQKLTLPRDSQRSGARVSVMGKLAACLRSQLVRRTTVWHRRREVVRRCSALPCQVGRLRLAWHGERAQQVCEFCHLLRDRQRSSARASVSRKPPVRRRAQLARRCTILHGKREAIHRCSAPLRFVYRTQPAQRGAHARQARVFCNLPRDSQRSGACASVTRKPAVRC